MDLTLMTVEEKIDYLIVKQLELDVLLKRFLPLLERYERAAASNNVFKARRELKRGALGNG